MYPSGGFLSTVVLSTSGNACESLFPIVGNGAFITGYGNNTLIDLNSTLSISTTNPKEKFTVRRDPAASAVWCSPTNPVLKCPSYEVANNNSSAWATIRYGVFPNVFAYPCSGIPDNSTYTDCADFFNIGSADICNGTGVVRHRAIDLPYCLTRINADNAAFINYGQLAARPDIFTFVGEDYCLGRDFTPSIHLCSLLFPFNSGDAGFVYKLNTTGSGCGYIVPNNGNTSIVVQWPKLTLTYTSGNCPTGFDAFCQCPAERDVIYSCQTSRLTECSTQNFTGVEAKNDVGFPTVVQCGANDGCPSCLNNGFYTAKLPFSVSFSWSLVNGPSWAGTLYLNHNLSTDFQYVPNQDQMLCGGTPTAEEINNATKVDISYTGWEASFCRTLGITSFAGCYENEINYGVVWSQLNVEPGQTSPPLLFGLHNSIEGFFKFDPNDPTNDFTECCAADGSPLGIYDNPIPGTGCFTTPGITKCFREASEPSLWKTKSCCECFGNWSAAGSPGTFSAWAATNCPGCETDNILYIPAGGSENLVSDMCNNALSYTAYDGDGNPIWTLTI
jgi:hypothetical protein